LALHGSDERIGVVVDVDEKRHIEDAQGVGNTTAVMNARFDGADVEDGDDDNDTDKDDDKDSEVFHTISRAEREITDKLLSFHYSTRMIDEAFRKRNFSFTKQAFWGK
jgi:hypothetical protein